MRSDLPAVSVSIITYNQQHLIGRAIDSVLAQEVDFSYEIIIGDDCSNDGTQEVLKTYLARYPDKIQLILHPRRYQGEVPGRTNNTTNLLNCRGKYTAMLDGDDYWTDPRKLQRQYDLLQARPELSMCLHDARMEYDTEPTEPNYVTRTSQLVGGSETGTYTHADLAMKNRLNPFIGSVMYRTEYLRDLPEWFYSIIAADYALLLHISSKGDVYYDAEPAAVYYISPGGFQRVFRKNPTFLHQELEDLDTYATAFPETRNSRQMTLGKATLHWHLFQHYREAGKRRRAGKHLLSVYRSDPSFGISMLLNPVRKLRTNAVR